MRVHEREGIIDEQKRSRKREKEEKVRQESNKMMLSREMSFVSKEELDFGYRTLKQNDLLFVILPFFKN